ncbi:MAG TPA: hypothetical protein VHJ00_15290 [Bradyrhizobium sp.]|nr:hypothetical protein [Bradyrhizobium sp.]
MSPSIRKEVRTPELMMTLSPMMMRSNGFNSTLSGIVVVFLEAGAVIPDTFALSARGGPIAV